MCRLCHQVAQQFVPVLTPYSEQDVVAIAQAVYL
jgi:hypothetical protein